MAVGQPPTTSPPVRIGAADRFLARFGRQLVLAVPMIWLGLFFLVPFLIVLKISFAEAAFSIPPFTPLLEWSNGLLTLTLSFETYGYLFGDDMYWRAYLNSVRIAVLATAIALVVGYPIAYGIARSPAHWRGFLLMLVILPFWTSFLIRVYAWVVLLQNTGLINTGLMWIGLVSDPLPLLNNDFSVLLGIVYSYLPFMVLPLYASLEKQNPELLEAASDLGSPPWKTFLTITLPLSLPGIIAGSLLVFIPAMGEFVIPELLGGTGTLMIGKVLWLEFFSNRDWPVAAAVATVLLLVLVVPIIWFQMRQGRAEREG
jgi:putrescine transport system permease protein